MRRHPVRGALGGLLIGIGLALLVVMLGLAPLAELTVVVIVVAFVAIGLALSWVLPARDVTVSRTTIVRGS
jgi:hypothetical protein